MEIFTMPVYDKHLLTIKEASVWATHHLGKNVTTSNISYLIQYGRIRKIEKDGTVFISLLELNEYYTSYNGARESAYKEKRGGDLNWALSFDQYKEAETTKHVHRLHPYKGKFIPQLVEYFLDEHTDNFKKDVFFKAGDIIVDPFSGSGTTMVQSAELGMNAVGIDVSAFNALIGNSKVARYNISGLEFEISRITGRLQSFIAQSNITEFDEELSQKLSDFNNKYFPVPEYKYKLHKKEINENEYALEKEKLFLPAFRELVKKYGVELEQVKRDTFLDKWYSAQIRAEIEFVYSEIKKIKNENIKKILCVILSRTMRSCRATTHADLATLIEPITTTYYCSKHGKMCKPLFSILKWWKTYTKDTVERILKFDKLRTNTEQICLAGDSRAIDIFKAVEKLNPHFGKLLKHQKIAGIFSSPPYIGLIDYHEQHAYAYDLFKFPRNDELEIGPLFRGQGNAAKESYIEGVSGVLNNCKKFFVDNYNVFLVANDKYNMYPLIAEKSNMTIVQQFHRPVLNRTEKDKAAYSETIFYLKE
ncbi:MAG: site-specific DNA-methyltransferase, partial [Treponema sp.]|nr:site-specific DNA-methyltransferase [Treponema sp.]